MHKYLTMTERAEDYIDRHWTDHNVAPIGNVALMLGLPVDVLTKDLLIEGKVSIAYLIGQHGVKRCVVRNMAMLVNDIANDRTSWRFAAEMDAPLEGHRRSAKVDGNAFSASITNLAVQYAACLRDGAHQEATELAKRMQSTAYSMLNIARDRAAGK